MKLCWIILYALLRSHRLKCNAYLERRYFASPLNGIHMEMVFEKDPSKRLKELEQSEFRKKLNLAWKFISIGEVTSFDLYLWIGTRNEIKIVSRNNTHKRAKSSKLISTWRYQIKFCSTNIFHLKMFSIPKIFLALNPLILQLYGLIQ